MAQQGGAMHLAPKSASLLPLELEEAIDQRAPVKLEYLDGNDARTQRIVQPLRLKRRNGEMVLVAHCQLRNEQRTFKLDRILEVAKMTDCQLAVGDGETLWDNAHNHAAGARMPASDSEVQGQQR
jgi:predicted DNA-binding transcriptional regulator YafY